jgi:hypothetical protein
MPEFEKGATKPTVAAMEARRAMTRQYREEGERIRWQSIVACIEAPVPHHPSDEGHLVVTPRQLFYFPDDQTFVRLPFRDIDHTEFAKVGRDSVLVRILTTSRETWRFDVFPETARVMKRLLRKGGSAVSETAI